jgi:hypothetical protein
MPRVAFLGLGVMDYPMAGQMRWDTSSLIARLERSSIRPVLAAFRTKMFPYASPHTSTSKTRAHGDIAVPAGRACKIAISVLGQAARQACQQVE